MDKAKLRATFAAIEKQHGSGTVFRLGGSKRLQVKVFSTGCLPVDIATGVGGLPRARIVEIYGPESGGKTTLALQTIAYAQAEEPNLLAAVIDAEHALDPVYAAQLGVDINQLVVSQPDNGEQALEVCEALVRSEQFSVIVVDSVAALVPKKELEGEMGDPQMGLQARLMSQAMRKLTAVVAKTNTLLIFINQVRDKIGVMYGNPETTTGGRALKFYSSMRVTVRPQSTKVEDGKQEIGRRTKIKIVKNKVAAPFKETEVDMVFGEGFHRGRGLLQAAVPLGVVEKSGSWYSFAGDKIGQGEDAVLERLQLDPILFKLIWEAARDKAFTPAPSIKPAETPDADTSEEEE